jgi:hypothetical protein
VNANELGTTGTGGVDLGDKRREQRLIKVVENLAAQPMASIPIASQGWAETKAAYRLMENPALDWRAVLDMHSEKTLKRIEQHQSKVVLCIQDTTELDFSSQPGIAGMGRLNYEARRGMYVHPTLMVTPEGLGLGVTDAWMWARKLKGEAEFKESVRWLEGYERVAEMAKQLPETRWVYIADREGDFRELMDKAAQQDYDADYLIRAKHNRNTAEGEKLWDSIVKEPPLGKVQFVLPATDKRPARRVTQSIYLKRTKLPAHHGKPAIEVTALFAREENPPTGHKPVNWKLLTNRTASSLVEAVELIEWYRRRWLIEIFFRILKSGCKVEALQLGSLERLERALVIFMIIAWRILHVVTLGRECPNLPCDVVFDSEEWQAAWIIQKYEKPPTEVPKLGEMMVLIAEFGGFLKRKGDGYPGPKAIWEGMEKVRHFAVGIKAGRAVYAAGE